MNISIQKGDAFLCAGNEKIGKNAEQRTDRLVHVAIGDLRFQLTPQEAIDLADVMSAWKDVSWRMS